MEEKFQADKSEQDMKNLASELVIKQDRQDLEEDRQKQNRRAKFQFQFTARNKEVKKGCTSTKHKHSIVYFFS